MILKNRVKRLEDTVAELEGRIKKQEPRVKSKTPTNKQITEYQRGRGGSVGIEWRVRNGVPALGKGY